MCRGIKSRVEKLALFGSTLVALPDESRKCKYLKAETIGRIYTLDLSADNPEDTLLNLEIPVCEARFMHLNKEQIVFRIEGKVFDTFQIFSIPELTAEEELSEEPKEVTHEDQNQAQNLPTGQKEE